MICPTLSQVYKCNMCLSNTKLPLPSDPAPALLPGGGGLSLFPPALVPVPWSLTISLLPLFGPRWTRQASGMVGRMWQPC